VKASQPEEGAEAGHLTSEGSMCIPLKQGNKSQAKKGEKKP